MQLTPEFAEALRDHGVAVAYLFGSRIRGQPRPDSDTDVAILLREGVPRLDLRSRAALANAFADALGEREVDLMVLDEARLELRGRVVAQGRVLYSADEARRVHFEVETQSRWLDVAPFVHEQDRAYLARVARDGL